ncbi:embigin [Tenrec ecaudatus]|uniref:embigin n=1 Tax=Tenrec ecaudatus TaxID=94439 RepID=UPI003F59709A
MCALPSPPGLRVPPPRLVFVLCLLAAARRSWADSTSSSPDSPLTSLPAREEMMAKYSNLSLEAYNISLTEHSNVPVERTITLKSPSHIELTCQLTTSEDLKSVNVTWKRHNELLENGSLTSAAGSMLSARYTFTVTSRNQMGSYSCFFGETKGPRGTFNFTVPEIQGKTKPAITYVGDTTVLTCRCPNCVPVSWIWYNSNGSVQVPVNIQLNDKFHVINGTHGNETKLKIMHLAEEDQGAYWCRAVFQLGERELLTELVVLSYLVPLKPFFAVVAEVILLVTAILLCEMYTQRKRSQPDGGKEFEQIEQLKSDDSSNGIENNAPRHRKNSVTSK